jgi:hypothetical protein
MCPWRSRPLGGVYRFVESGLLTACFHLNIILFKLLLRASHPCAMSFLGLSSDVQILLTYSVTRILLRFPKLVALCFPFIPHKEESALVKWARVANHRRAQTTLTSTLLHDTQSTHTCITIQILTITTLRQPQHSYPCNRSHIDCYKHEQHQQRSEHDAK